jgi:hypothetical protein
MDAGTGGNNEIIALDMAVHYYPAFGIGFCFGFIEYFVDAEGKQHAQ